MAGTIFVGADVQFDIRGLDFTWIADELRSRETNSNREALAAALRAYEEGAMDMLLLDRLSSEHFRLAGQAFDEVTSHLRTTNVESRLLPFLDRVQAAIHSDQRWLSA